MSVRERGDKWFIDILFEHPDGQRERIRKVSPVQTRQGAEQYERDLRQALLDGTRQATEKAKKIPTLAEFAQEFLKDYARVNNKPSEVKAK